MDSSAKAEKLTEILTVEHADVVARVADPCAFVCCPMSAYDRVHVANCVECEHCLGMVKVDPKEAGGPLRVVCGHPIARRIEKIKVM